MANGQGPVGRTGACFPGSPARARTVPPPRRSSRILGPVTTPAWLSSPDDLVRPGAALLCRPMTLTSPAVPLCPLERS